MEAETERGMGEKMTEIYDKIKGHAVTQSNAEPNVPPLRYSDKVKKSPDGTETRCLEIAQPDTEPSDYIPIGGAGNGA